MRWFANRLDNGDEADFWAWWACCMTWILQCYPDGHCVKSQEIMREAGFRSALIRATASHGYGITVDIEPEHQMEKVLYPPTN